MVPCAGNKKEDCKAHYIGETGRLLDARLKEEKRDVKSKSKKSLISDYVWCHNHHMNWDDASIIMREPKRAKRWFKESLCIRSSSNYIAKVTHLISNFWIEGLKDQVPNMI